MSTKAPIIIKPGLGDYIYGKVKVMRDQKFEQRERSLSDAAVARMAGMVPETFRRLMRGTEQTKITRENAIRLIQIFEDEHIADFFDFERDEAGNLIDPSLDKDTLVISAILPTLTDRKQGIVKKMILFLQGNNESSDDELFAAIKKAIGS